MSCVKPTELLRRVGPHAAIMAEVSLEYLFQGERSYARGITFGTSKALDSCTLGITSPKYGLL